ncbi:MAG: histone deacetylase family protein [Pseudomonadota bacterium]
MRLLTHPACLEHDPGPHHAEAPARLRAVLNRLTQDFPHLSPAQAPLVTHAQLAAVHDPQLLAMIQAAAPVAQRVALDADTLMSPGSLEAARAAAGAVVAGVEAVLSGEEQRVFCAVRPPGHHAERARAMGFCLFNSIAVGARAALEQVDRVAIADFDVHHGNGTQDIFQQDEQVLFLSTHQMPLYPGTGYADETGVGNVVNAPLPAASDGAALRSAVREHWLPALDAFAPDLLLISAGFDAHRDDPLAGLNWVAEDYAWVTQELVKVAQTHAKGRIVSSLEGGYDLAALADCVSAHLKVLENAA